QYLVRELASGQYEFLGRVPMRPWMRWWRRILAVLVVGSIGAAAMRVWERLTHNDVRFVNGLGIAVNVTLDGDTFPVAGGENVVRSGVKGGEHIGVVRGA